MADRHTRKHILAALHNTHTPQSTVIFSTRSHHEQKHHSHNSGVRPGGVGLGGPLPRWQNSLSFSRTGGRAPLGSGASVHGLMGWTSVPDPPTSPSLISLNGFCGRKANCFLSRFGMAEAGPPSAGKPLADRLRICSAAGSD